MKNYCAVFFDAGGTLFAPDPSVGDIYARVARRYGMFVSAEKVEHLFRAEFHRRDAASSKEDQSDERHEKQWWKDLVRFIFSQLTPLQSFDIFFEDLYNHFGSRSVWKLYPEVVSVLSRLKAMPLRLGIVSNWDSRLFSICANMRLDRQVDFILASAVIGSAKPEGGIFQEALQRAGVRAGEALHVGDSVENDIRGAQNAGIDALLINRSGKTVPGVESIDTLTAIFDYLGKEKQKGFE